MRIPKSLHRFFWDVNVEKLNPEKMSYFVINRLLDKGNFEAVKWVTKNYSKTQIEETLKKIRDFNPKVGNFWSLYLQIPKSNIACLQTSYLKMRRMHWPY